MGMKKKRISLSEENLLIVITIIIIIMVVEDNNSGIIRKEAALAEMEVALEVEVGDGIIESLVTNGSKEIRKFEGSPVIAINQYSLHIQTRGIIIIMIITIIIKKRRMRVRMEI